VHPLKPITFTVKDSLVRYPIFKDILLTRDPVVVTRTNPRADFQAVMEGGLERLNKGISIVVFPQSTRMTHFDRAKFNSIAAKLARRAKVPLVPMALRTDVWQRAKWGVKDLGRLVPERPAFIAFDEPIHIEGRGDDAHERTLAFIEESLETWGLAPVRASSA
jgi:1-acyl-sn-glycerol-3-phosphate acyltransferase